MKEDDDDDDAKGQEMGQARTNGMTSRWQMAMFYDGHLVL